MEAPETVPTRRPDLALTDREQALADILELAASELYSVREFVTSLVQDADDAAPALQAVVAQLSIIGAMCDRAQGMDERWSVADYTGWLWSPKAREALGRL